MTGKSGIGKILLAVTLVAVLGGCSSWGAARIQSMPTGAEVIDVGDNTVIGKTPLMLTRKSDREESRRISIRLHMPGYRDEVETFWLHIRHSSRINAEYTPQDIKVRLSPVQPLGPGQ